MRRRLIQLREDAGITREDLAHRLNKSVRAVARWETGERTPLMPQRLSLARELGCSLALVNVALADDDDAPNPHVVRKTHRLFASLEQGATALHTYQPVSLPGLLQTPAYATQVESVWPVDASTEDIARRVALRLARQKVLDRLRLFALIDASVLTRDTGGPEVMASQLDHLRKLCERPNVSVRVVPLDQRAHAAGAGSFTLFTGEDEDAPYVVATENLGGPSYHEDPRLCDAYESLFSSLWRESHDLEKIEL